MHLDARVDGTMMRWVGKDDHQRKPIDSTVTSIVCQLDNWLSVQCSQCGTRKDTEVSLFAFELVKTEGGRYRDNQERHGVQNGVNWAVSEETSNEHRQRDELGHGDECAPGEIHWASSPSNLKYYSKPVDPMVGQGS